MLIAVRAIGNMYKPKLADYYTYTLFHLHYDVLLHEVNTIDIVSYDGKNEVNINVALNYLLCYIAGYILIYVN